MEIALRPGSDDQAEPAPAASLLRRLPVFEVIQGWAVITARRLIRLEERRWSIEPNGEPRSQWKRDQTS